MSPVPAQSKDMFVALSGLRGVAALVVVQLHGCIFLGGAPLPAGHLAVDFFFLLSGWVLAHAYGRRLESGMTAGGFMRARLVRLYPVYLLGLVLTFTGAVVGGQYPLAALLAALVFLPDFWNLHFDWLLRASWSLTAEIAVNLPFGAFHRFLGENLLVATVALALAGLIACGLAYGSLDIGHNQATWPGLFARVFFTFPLGVLLYRKREKLAAWAPRWAAWPSMLLLIAALSVPAPAGFAGLRDLGVVAVLLPALLLFAARARPGRLTARVATALGDMSYPLYLLHVAAFGVANALLVVYAGRDLDSQPLVVTLPLVLGIVALSLAVDRLYDRPVRRLLASMGRTPAPADAPAGP